MSSIFLKNTVMEGYADYYCLCCQMAIFDEDSALKHILDVKHKENLSVTHYTRFYEKDYIRMLSCGYFCEYCNKFLRTKTALNFHLTESIHDNNKRLLSKHDLRRMHEVVVAFDEILITDPAWNGLVDGICIICNKEYSDQAKHSKKMTHLAKLIHGKVDVTENKFISRNVDQNTLQCLICNKLLTFDTISSHLNDTQHKNEYQKSRILYITYFNNIIDKLQSDEDRKNEDQITPEDISAEKQILENREKIGEKGDNNIEKEKQILEKTKDYELHVDDNIDIEKEMSEILKELDENDANNKEKETQENVSDSSLINDYEVVSNTLPKDDNIGNRSKIMKDIEFFKCNGVKISDENSKAYCNKCSKDIVYVYTDIKNHISDHKKREKLEKFANENEIIYDRAVNTYKCTVCEGLSLCPSTLKCLKDHVLSASHKNNKLSKVEEIKQQIEVDKLLENYVTSLSLFENPQQTKCVVINNEHVIEFTSFVLKKLCGHDEMLCYICQSTTNYIHNKQCFNNNHNIRILKARVLSKFEDEFIRQITSTDYHCGYCNVLVNIEELRSHLQIISHRESKTSSKWLLEQYRLSKVIKKTPGDLTLKQFLKKELCTKYFDNIHNSNT